MYRNKQYTVFNYISENVQIVITVFTFQKTLTYRVSNIYILNNVDRVFNLSITSTYVKPGDAARVKIVFKPNIVGQSFTEYFLIDDTGGNTYRLTVTGKCYGEICFLINRLRNVIFELKLELPRVVGLNVRWRISNIEAFI